MNQTTTAPHPADNPKAAVPPANDLSASHDATLAEKISAAQSRIAERTAPARAKAAEQSRAAAESAKEFVKDHPLVAISGAVAIGALIALALPGRPGRKVRGSVVTAGGLLAEMASKYGHQILELVESAADESRDKLGDLGETVAHAGNKIAHDLSERGEGTLLSARHIGDRAALAARHASEDAGFKTRSMMSRIRR